MPLADGFVGALVVNGIDVDAVRDCASTTEIAIDFAPPVVPVATVARKLKMLSPAVASPFVPLSKNCCVEEPPMDARLPVTVMLVLTGFDPGVTETVSSVDEPTSTEVGFAAPLAAGFVEVATVNAI